MALKKQKIQKWPHGFLPKKYKKDPKLCLSGSFVKYLDFFCFFWEYFCIIREIFELFEFFFVIFGGFLFSSAFLIL
jgi:hypothetical protein